MSIRGTLETMGLPELLQWLCQGRKTGTLVLARGDLEKRVLFDDGKIVSCASNDPQERLGVFLIQRGLLSPSQLQEAVDLRRHLGGGSGGSSIVAHADLPSMNSRETKASNSSFFCAAR